MEMMKQMIEWLELGQDKMSIEMKEEMKAGQKEMEVELVQVKGDMQRMDRRMADKIKVMWEEMNEERRKNEACVRDAQREMAAGQARVNLRETLGPAP